MSNFLSNVVRALAGPRYTWGHVSKARRLIRDLPARLNDAERRISRKASPDDEQPVFVFSAGWRSGSTLLQRMIMENNSDLLLWGEPFAHCNIHDGLVDQFRAFTHEWPPASFFLSEMKIKKISDTWTANLYPDLDYLFDAHRSYYRKLFADSAAEAGRKIWGFKEVRLTIDHAAYFRALYPKCKIILLYRHPLDAYLSYRKWGLEWARTWPAVISTPYAFGRNWAEMTRDYLEGHERVHALLIRYEDLDNPEHVARLEAYLGWRVPPSSDMRRIGRIRDSSLPPQSPWQERLPKIDRALLYLATRDVLRDAGYIAK